MSPIAKVIWPGTSSPRPSGAVDSADSSIVATTVTTARPATMKNDPRHVPTSANTPPSRGETAAPAERNPAHRAMPRARACGLWVTAATSASDAGNMAPAPRPLSAAPIHRTWTTGATAETTDPTTSTAPPRACSLRRPNRSPSTPKVSSKTTTAIMNAAVIQVSCEPVVCRSDWNRPLRDAGRAFAIWATSTATQAAASVPATRAGAVVVEFVALLLRGMALSFESRDGAERWQPCGGGHENDWHHASLLYIVSRKSSSCLPVAGALPYAGRHGGV